MDWWIDGLMDWWIDCLPQGEDEPYADQDRVPPEGGPEHQRNADDLQRTRHVRHYAGQLKDAPFFW